MNPAANSAGNPAAPTAAGLTPREDARRFVIPPDSLPVLGAFASGLNSLSLLSDEAPDAQVQQQLMEAGVVDAESSISPAFRPLLEVLAAPEALAQVSVTGGGSLIDVTLHRSAGGTVSTTATSAGLVLTSPADTDSAVRLLTEHLGFSMLSSLTLAMNLDPVDAIVFAATVDHFRRRNLEALLHGRTPGPDTSDRAAVRELLEVTDPRWFAPIVTALTNQAASDAAERVGELDTDVEQAAAQVAGRFLVLDRVMTVASATLGSDGEPIGSQVVCVQAGVHDVLVIEPGPATVSFVTLPSALVLSRIAAILDDPGGELHAAVGPLAADGGGDAGEPAPAHFCTACGAELLPSAEFCTTCGAHRAT